MANDYFTTIEKPSTAEFKDRGSKFIAYVYPITDVNGFKEKLAVLKKEHPKAVHHCFAYRLGTDGNIFRVSDDGEPSGSAGRPVLGQIDSRQLTNVTVIVVRYFGGSLLGIPGLINAYKTSAALSLEAAAIIRKPVLVNYRLWFDYTQMNDVMKMVKQFDCVIVGKKTGLFYFMHICVPKIKISGFLRMLQELRQVRVEKI